MASDQSGTRIAFVAETAFGVTPATPAFKTFRTTQAAGLRTNKVTKVSDELRADRNVSDLIQTGQSVSGSYPVELSYGAFDDLLEAGLFSTWATNVLKNGVTGKSFTLEETRKLAASNSFSRFTGCYIDQMKFNLSAQEILTGSFDFMGQKEDASAAVIITGATYAAAGAEPVLNATANVATLTVPNTTAPRIKSLNFTVKNNLRLRPYIGSLYTDDLGVGRCEVTGELQAYFTEAALYQAVLAHGSGALSFTVGAVTAKKYTFAFPKIIFGDGQIPAGGNNDDIMVTIPFQAVFDTTAAASIQITRAVA